MFAPLNRPAPPPAVAAAASGAAASGGLPGPSALTREAQEAADVLR